MAGDFFKRVVDSFETAEERRRRLNTPSNCVRVILLWLILLPFLIIGGDNIRFIGGVIAFGTVIFFMGVVPKVLLAFGVRNRFVIWALDLDRRRRPPKSEAPPERSSQK